MVALCHRADYYIFALWNFFLSSIFFPRLISAICWRVLGTPANFNGFHGMAALLHGTLVVGASQTLRR